MQPVELECAKCGAPLEVGTRTAIVLCVFCGTRNMLAAEHCDHPDHDDDDGDLHDAIAANPLGSRKRFEKDTAAHNARELERAAEHAREAQALMASVRAAKKKNGKLTGFVYFFLFGGIVIAVLFGAKQHRDATAQALATEAAAIEQAMRALANTNAAEEPIANAMLQASDLTQLPDDGIARPIATTTMVDNGRLRVDQAVASFIALASTWDPSASLVGVRFEGVAANGTIAMTDEAAELSANFRATGKGHSHTLRFSKRGTEIVVQTMPLETDADSDTHRFQLDTCPLEHAIRSASTRHPLPKDPRISGYLVHPSHGADEWYLRDDASHWPLTRVSLDRCHARR